MRKAKPDNIEHPQIWLGPYPGRGPTLMRVMNVSGSQINMIPVESQGLASDSITLQEADLRGQGWEFIAEASDPLDEPGWQP
jgi:hypothetical protein